METIATARTPGTATSERTTAPAGLTTTQKVQKHQGTPTQQQNHTDTLATGAMLTAAVGMAATAEIQSTERTPGKSTVARTTSTTGPTAAQERTGTSGNANNSSELELLEKWENKRSSSLKIKLRRKYHPPPPF